MILVEIGYPKSRIVKTVIITNNNNLKNIKEELKNSKYTILKKTNIINKTYYIHGIPNESILMVVK